MLRRLSLGLLASAISIAALPAIAQEGGGADDLGVMNISLKDVVKPTLGFQGALQGAGTPNQAGVGGFLPLSVGGNSVWFLDVLANRQRQEPTNTCLVWCSCSLQCTMKAKSWLDDIFKADAHHTKVISTALLSNGRQGSNRDGRNQQPQGETTQNRELIRCRNDALLLLVMPPALASFSFAAIPIIQVLSGS